MHNYASFDGWDGRLSGERHYAINVTSLIASSLVFSLNLLLERPLMMNKSNAFSNLLTKYPWPDKATIENVDPFTWSLDGGGRHLMQTLLAQQPDAVLVEFGSFMGGSAIQFMEACPTLRCVLCDPWGDNLVTYVTGLIDVPWALGAYGRERLLQYGRVLREHGPLPVVRNNLSRFKDRCIMIQQGMPMAFQTLSDNNLSPDIVYLDAMKRRDEFWGAHEAFPDAIITGDDWSWKDPKSDLFEVRQFVAEVAMARGAVVYADRMTFVVSEPRHGLCFDEKYRYELPI